MAARFFATSTNVVVHDNDNSNTQNARIHYDTDDTKGWTVATDGTLATGTQLRRSVLDPVAKTAGQSLDSDVGVEFTYIAAQKRSVKRANGNNTQARMVFAPSHL